MKNKGFVWTLELMLGLLVLLGILTMGSVPAHSPQGRMATVLCQDLAALHTHPYVEIEEIIQPFYAEIPIEISSSPFTTEKQNSIVCTSTRWESGDEKRVFIRIQYE